MPRIDPRTLGVVVAGGMLGVAVRAAMVAPAEAGLVPTLTVGINVLGSLLLGVVVGVLDGRRPRLRAFLGTGVLGGFTTYSAFAVQTIELARDSVPSALLLVAVSLLGGVAAALAGLFLGRRMAGVPGEVERPEDAE